MDSPLKNILIVSHHYPPHITGVGSVAHNQAKHLVKLGNIVNVITSDTNFDEKSAVIDGVNVIRVKALNFLENFDAPFPIFFPSIFTKLWKQIKIADVVHVHDGFYESSFLAVLIAKILKKPVVLTQHVSMVMHPSKLIMFIEKIVYVTTGFFIFRNSDLIITYNDRVERFLVEMGVEERKLVRLTNGVDLELFNKGTLTEKIQFKLKYGLNINKKIVLFVGRFVPKKGFDKVFASKSSEYQLVFAGGEALQKNTEDVVFLGKLSQDQISEVYKASDIFILPSESEGFPLSIQEAMACGLPIITAADEGYKSYDLDPSLFHMIENPNDESVAFAIRSVLNNEPMLQKMSEYSEKYAKENFSWPISSKKLNDMYTEVAVNKNTIKKIAFVTDAIYMFNKGGKEKRLFDLSQKLSENGYDVTIYCMKWWIGEKVFKKDNITYFAISPFYPLYAGERRSISQSLFFALHSFKMINKSFDVVDVDHIPYFVLFPMKLICLIKGKKMIVTWHEVWGKKYWQSYMGYFKGMVAYMIERISSRLPDVIVSVSRNTTEDLKKVLGAKTKIITIPNGLNFDIINSAPESSDLSEVIFAGRLLTNKNINVLLDALSILNKKGTSIKTYIVGEGPEKESLLKQKDLLNLENVKFFDFISKHSDLYSMIKSSRVFVLPSTREGFGIALIEANACGLPVITINNIHNAAKDLIINNENGLVCELDAQSLANSIEEVLNSRKGPEYYMEYSKKYDWNAVFPSFAEVYK